jgi:hypothetical protein
MKRPRRRALLPTRRSECREYRAKPERGLFRGLSLVSTGRRASRTRNQACNKPRYKLCDIFRYRISTYVQLSDGHNRISISIKTMPLRCGKHVQSRLPTRMNPVLAAGASRIGDKALLIPGLQEVKMSNASQYVRQSGAQRCAICHGRFGLIRYYSWRTAFCSKRCRDRFKGRQELHLRWLLRCLQTV